MLRRAGFDERAESRSRQGRRQNVVGLERPAPCSIGLRRCKDGAPATRTRLRSPLARHAPRSSRSRRWNRSIPSSARSACARRAAASTRSKSASLDGLANSCGCIDHRVNGLGTCKHIEGVLAALARGRSARFAPPRGGKPARRGVSRSPRQRGAGIAVAAAGGRRPACSGPRLAAPLLEADGSAAGDAERDRGA